MIHKEFAASDTVLVAGQVFRAARHAALRGAFFLQFITHLDRARNYVSLFALRQNIFVHRLRGEVIVAHGGRVGSRQRAAHHARTLRAPHFTHVATCQETANTQQG